MKRLFSLAVGLGAGLIIGASVMRRFDEAQRALAPVNLAGRAGHAAGSFAQRLRDAITEGRVAAEAQERELRQRYGIPSLRPEPDDEPSRRAR